MTRQGDERPDGFSRRDMLKLAGGVACHGGCGWL